MVTTLAVDFTYDKAHFKRSAKGEMRNWIYDLAVNQFRR
jgi:hypothetical protein